MKDEIVNRVANSKLVTVDLEAFYPKGKRHALDISPWLHEGIVLKEKAFRTAVDAHHWEEYEGGYLAISCTTDAIIPAWAFLLVSLKASRHSKKVVIGSTEDLETLLFSDILSDLDVSPYKDKPVIIKGCTHKPIPENAYTLLAQKLQPIAKSIMYGEACSSVPLFKRK